jgi:phosphoglycolate phosphatase
MNLAGVHGPTMDGAVRHKDQVVAGALAAHPDGRDPVLVGDRSHDVLGAAAHGLPCICAGCGPAEDGELESAGAAAVVATPRRS